VRYAGTLGGVRQALLHARHVVTFPGYDPPLPAFLWHFQERCPCHRIDWHWWAGLVAPGDLGVVEFDLVELPVHPVPGELEHCGVTARRGKRQNYEHL